MTQQNQEAEAIVNLKHVWSFYRMAQKGFMDIARWRVWVREHVIEIRRTRRQSQ